MNAESAAAEARREFATGILSGLMAAGGGGPGSAVRTRGDEPRDRQPPADHTMDGHDNWDDARDRLRPVLRPATYGLEWDLGGVDPVLSRPAVPFLRECVVVDYPETMVYVSAAHLTNWGVTGEQVFTTARANLADVATRSSSREAIGTPDGRPMVRFVDDTGDNYFGSLPLIPEWLTRVADTWGTRPVVFMADHVSLLLVPDDPDTVAAALELTGEQYEEADKPLSPVPYTCDENGALIPYPTGGHPAAQALRRAETRLAFTEYNVQKQCLDKHHEDEEIDIFVATLLMAELRGGELRTMTTWGDGVDTLLPRADGVVFVNERAEPFEVPWDVVVELTGLTPVEGMDPPRYRVHTWPPSSVMDRLRSRAVAVSGSD